MTEPPVAARAGTLWTHKALWLIGLALLANAGAVFYSHAFENTAIAQALPGTGQMLGARGIYMMPAQLGTNKWGVYLLDVDSETITTYIADPDRSRFRLMSARSYKYDRFLQDYNNDKLTPSDVQKLVADQRKRQEEEKKAGEPTVDQNAKPDENKPDAPK